MNRRDFISTAIASLVVPIPDVSADAWGDWVEVPCQDAINVDGGTIYWAIVQANEKGSVSKVYFSSEHGFTERSKQAQTPPVKA